MDEIAEMEERLELALELETLFNHAYESNGGIGFTDHEFWRQSSEIADLKCYNKVVTEVANKI